MQHDGQFEVLGDKDKERASALTRRQVLKLGAWLGGSGALTLALAACGSSDSTEAPQATQGTTGAGSSPSASAGTTSSSSTNSSSAGNAPLAKDQTFRYPYVEPVTMDPGLANTDIQIMMNLWEGLVTFDQQNQPVPRGATKWDVSSDGSTYTFQVREGVKWTDGAPVTAHDYEWTWKRNLDPATASVYANALYSIKNAEKFNKGKASVDDVGVKAVDDQTLQVTLEGPAGYFLRIASTWTALPLPKQSIEKNGPKWTEPGNIVTNGPFKMESWQHDQQMVLVRNDDYWGDKPALSKIVISISDDVAKTSLPAFENNELDMAYGTWPADIDRVEKDATLSKQLHIYPNSSTVFVVCDTTNPDSPVSKLEFRQALYLGLSREQIVNEVFKKVGVPAYVILAPDILGYNKDARIPGGVKEAKDLLAKAGYPDGKGLPTLTMAYVQGSTYDLLVQVLQQMWSENLGVKVDLNAMESKAFYAYRSTLADKHFDMMLNSWGSDYLDPFDWDNFLFMSTTDYYHSHWSNAQFDQLVSQGATETNQDKRKQLYQQAEVIHVKEVSDIPIYNSATPYLVKPWVADFVHNAVGGDPWATIKILDH